MKLWEIKAQSLRLMFASSDSQFTESEFSNLSLYNDPNTRDKLVLMNASIMRAIDLYFYYCGDLMRRTSIGLDFILVDDIKKYKNQITFSTLSDFGMVSRIDCIEDLQNNILSNKNLSFTYDPISKIAYLDDYNYAGLTDPSKVIFMVNYTNARGNLPAVVNELTFDLNTLYIPVDVQRQIPFYVKGELYEEDEAGMAANSKNTYIQYLMSLKKQINSLQTKVKKAKVYDYNG